MCTYRRVGGMSTEPAWSCTAATGGGLTDRDGEDGIPAREGGFGASDARERREERKTTSVCTRSSWRLENSGRWRERVVWERLT